jgi:uncharacterized protein (TIGR02145 family)
LCPIGWHVPTDGEWTSLIKFIVPTETVSAIVLGIQSPNAGGKLKSTSNLWNINGSPGFDNYGFSALPGGYRLNDGSFNGIRDNAVFWSATATSSTESWYRYVDSGSSNVYMFNYNDNFYGHSVRCLRD